MNSELTRKELQTLIFSLQFILDEQKKGLRVDSTSSIYLETIQDKLYEQISKNKGE